MRDFEKIGIVGGGQMGEALIRGIIQAELLPADKLTIIEPDRERCRHLRSTYSVRIAADEKTLAAECAVVILAVKPQVMARVLALFREFLSDRHLVISIAAGVSTRSIEQWLGKKARVIRVMPNTPALVLAGASALSPNSTATEEDVAGALRIFSALGICLEVEEKLLDAVTGLSGSGPGYVFAFIEAMVDGGVLAGLPRPVAEKLVLQTVYGSAKLAMETGDPPAVLKGRVTSPAGTTITGLQVLEESGLRGAIMAAIEAATQRSKELGQ